MKVSGFTFVRNGVKFDYPVLESVRSLLPLVDELVIVVGKGEDETLARVRALAATEPKMRVLESVWDEKLRRDGAILVRPDQHVAWRTQSMPESARVVTFPLSLA